MEWLKWVKELIGIQPSWDEKRNRLRRCIEEIDIEEAKYKLHFRSLNIDENDHDKSKVPSVHAHLKIQDTPGVQRKMQLEQILEEVEDEWVETSSSMTIEEAFKAEKDGLALRKIVVGKVASYKSRVMVVEPGYISCNLDDINVNFIPVVGDYVSLTVICQVNEHRPDFSGRLLVVNQMEPLRTRLVEGHVTKWSNINEVGELCERFESGWSKKERVIFTLAQCEPGYRPCKGDSVVAETIESDQGSVSWRALMVVSLCQEDKIKSKIKETKEVQELLKDKEGLSVSQLTDLGIVLHKDQQKLKVGVINRGPPRQLTGLYFHSNVCSSQFTVVVSPRLPYMLNTGSELAITFSCSSCFLGYSSDLFVFDFNGCKIGRFLKVKVEATEFVNLTNGKKSTYDYSMLQSNLNKQSTDWDMGNLIPGVRPSMPHSFKPRSLNQYVIPRNLCKEMVEDSNYERNQNQTLVEDILFNIFPCLETQLSPNNYTMRFHDLLFIEEADMLSAMKRWDMRNATLVPPESERSLLSLQVLGLSEKRPSIVVGDSVLVKHENNSGPTYEGFIHKVFLSELWIKFNAIFNPEPEDQFYIKFMFSRTSFRRCHAAVDAAMKNLGSMILFPTRVILRPALVHLGNIENNATTSKEKPKEMLEYSKDSKASSKFPLQPQVLDTYNLANKTDQKHSNYRNLSKILNKDKITSSNNMNKRNLVWINQRLNHAQKNAVKNIIEGKARPFPYVIFGPPGTGKTMTLVEAILQTLILFPDSRMLVATPSNSSADLLAMRLLESRQLLPGTLVRLVSIKYWEKVPVGLSPFTSLGIKDSSERFEEGAIGWHRITVGTCTTLAKLQHSLPSLSHYTHVFVDEGGQCTEPEAMLVFGLMGCPQKTVFAGDPQQLGPVVMSQFAKIHGLGESYLSRLLRCGPYLRDPEGFPYTQGFNPLLITMLVENYRSVPEILSVPGRMFYHDELVATVSQKEGVEADLLKRLAKDLPQRSLDLGPPPLIFHGVQGPCLQEEDSPSWFNPSEVVQAAIYLSMLYHHDVTPQEIGIITPYQKQAQKIRVLLEQMDIPSPKVGSVEEFQGQERLVIIVTTVRSQVDPLQSESLGFVASPQRFNVAITRARALLIVLGDPHLLAINPMWRELITDCIEHDSYTGCNAPLICRAQA